MPRRRTRVAAAENFVRGLRGAPPLVVRRDATVYAVPAFSSGSAPPATITGSGSPLLGALSLTASGGVAMAHGGDVWLNITSHAVGQTIRQTVVVVVEDVGPDVLTMAATGGFVGGVLTGGAAWGEGVGFVAGWVLGAHHVRRRRP